MARPTISAVQIRSAAGPGRIHQLSRICQRMSDLQTHQYYRLAHPSTTSRKVCHCALWTVTEASAKLHGSDLTGRRSPGQTGVYLTRYISKTVFFRKVVKSIEVKKRSKLRSEIMKSPKRWPWRLVSVLTPRARVRCHCYRWCRCQQSPLRMRHACAPCGASARETCFRRSLRSLACTCARFHHRGSA